MDNEQILVYLAENLEKLDGRIAESEEERQNTSEQVVAAFCHYTTTLQDMVSRSLPLPIIEIQRIPSMSLSINYTILSYCIQFYLRGDDDDELSPKA